MFRVVDLYRDEQDVSCSIVALDLVHAPSKGIYRELSRFSASVLRRATERIGRT